MSAVDEEDVVATKSSFTPAEWQTLRWAVSDTMAYLTMADPGFWDMFKEANAAAHYVAAARQSGSSGLVRELAADIKTGRDKDVSGNPTDVAGEVIERVNEAVAIVSAKAPEDLTDFKAFIIGLAKATAEAAKGTGPTEAQAIAKLEAALG
jgi:hypothetical protein